MAGIEAERDTSTQGIISDFEQEDYLLLLAETFLIDRKAQNLSSGTIQFYQKKLKVFLAWCDSQLITNLSQLSPGNLREFILYLQENKHNPGGVLTFYRTIKAFLNWFESEFEPDDWVNPIRKVRPPKVGQELLDPVTVEDIGALISVCQKNTFYGDRDKAIFLCLFDTGVRAQELLDIRLDDVNFITGEILIRKGKGRKPRTVYLGSKSRKALRAYRKHITDQVEALFVTIEGTQLTYDGLRGIVSRRSSKAGIEPPTLHSFRRAFALNMLRQGVDIYSLQELMGHSSLDVLKRYLKETKYDLQTAHRRGSPVDTHLK